MAGVAVAVGVGAVASGAIQARGSKKASKAQQKALEEAKQIAKNTNQEVQGFYQPYEDIGNLTRNLQLKGLLPAMSEQQIAAANAKYQKDLAAWNNNQATVNNLKNFYVRTFAIHKGSLSFEDTLQKYLPDAYKIYKQGEPVAPDVSNENAGIYNQSKLVNDYLNNIQDPNLTPENWVASENAAGRTITPEQANWNKDFDVAGYLISQGKSADALNKNFEDTPFEEDPSYKFRKQQGLNNIQSSAAAKGMQLSGATLKALDEFNSGLASQEYAAASNRYNQNRANLVQNTNNANNLYDQNRASLYKKYLDAYGRGVDKYTRGINRLGIISNAMQTDYNNLSGFSNQGYNATGNIANSASSLGNNLMSAQLGQGLTQAQQDITQAQAWGGAVQGVSNAVGSYAGKYTAQGK